MKKIALFVLSSFAFVSFAHGATPNSALEENSNVVAKGSEVMTFEPKAYLTPNTIYVGVKTHFRAVIENVKPESLEDIKETDVKIDCMKVSDFFNKVDGSVEFDLLAAPECAFGPHDATITVGGEAVKVEGGMNIILNQNIFRYQAWNPQQHKNFDYPSARNLQ